ncbi:cell filamentation protein Fic, partial [Pseudomonas aeruginosa]|nr:cell filamentation protein Fic [Pseudomonas aeruginosa]
MSFDPFGDFETTGYLRNSLGLKDPAEVKENE